VIARAGLPRLAEVDRLTGELLRGRRHSDRRYEREQPGELLHVDVKKLGRMPDGGGWRVHGRSEEVRGRGLGWDYVHVAIDDHSRLAYAEVLPDEKTGTCAGFLTRAADRGRARGAGPALDALPRQVGQTVDERNLETGHQPPDPLWRYVTRRPTRMRPRGLYTARTVAPSSTISAAAESTTS
jgi:hypothetical protein